MSPLERFCLCLGAIILAISVAYAWIRSENCASAKGILVRTMMGYECIVVERAK